MAPSIDEDSKRVWFETIVGLILSGLAVGEAGV
jgi:hypothetical protein